MKNLIIHYYENFRDTRPTLTVTIRLSVLDISYFLIPEKLKEHMEKEGIDLRQSIELVNVKDLKGKLIEIEKIGARLIISID